MSNENQQSMKNYYIVKLDISSKQKYIYSSNRLQEIIGASKIIEFITEMLGRDVLLKMNRDSFNKDYEFLKDLEVKDMKDINKKAFEKVSDFYTKKRKEELDAIEKDCKDFKSSLSEEKIDEIKKKFKYNNLEILKDQKYYFEKYEEGYKEGDKEYTYNPYSNVLFEAGGNAMYIFNTEKQAREFNRRVSRFVLKYFKGIELVSVIQRYNEEAHFIIDIFDEIEKKITAKKNKRNNYINTLSFGFNELCPNTRNPAGYEVVYISDLNKKWETDIKDSKILSKEAFDKKVFYNLLMNLIMIEKIKIKNIKTENIKTELKNYINTKIESGNFIYCDANIEFNNHDNFYYDLESTTLKELQNRFYDFKNTNRLGRFDKLSSKEKKEITTEIDKLSGKKTEGSYVGITCLDGNSMGVKVFEFKEKYKDEFKNQNEKNSAEKYKKIEIAREFANLDADAKYIFSQYEKVVKNVDEIKNTEECKEIYNDFDCYDLLFEVSNGITSMVVKDKKDKENVASDELTYGAKTIIEELLEKYQDRKNITDKVKLANQNYLKDYIIFTTSIKNAYTQAFEDLKREIYEYKYKHESNKNNEGDSSVLPIVPVILAGDDISFLSFGKYSIEITRKYINYLCKQSFIDDKDINIADIMGKLYVCSGTAIIPRNYPFAQGVKIADSLEKNTKKRLTGMKKKKLEAVEFKDRNDTYLESAVFKAFKDKFENESAWYHNLAIRKKEGNNTKLVMIRPNTKDNTISKYDASLMDWQIVRGDTNTDIDSFRNSNLTNRPYLIYDEYDARNEKDYKPKENINKDEDINFKASDCYDFSFLEQLEKEKNYISEKVLFDIFLLKYIQNEVQKGERNSIYSKLMRSFKDSQESALLVELKHNLSNEKKDENKINLGVTNLRKIIHDAIEVKGFFDELELDPEIKNDKN